MSAAAENSPRLSVAIVACDEADVLAEAIGSVSSIADEIVVVDTGSTDGTREVALRGGARVVEHAWTDDFSAARNCALKEATGDWVLWLDAGERLEPASAAPLRAFVESEADPDKAYHLWVETPVEEPQDGFQRAARLRLIPGRPDLRYAGRVCERLHESMAALNMTVELQPWRLLRTAREHNPELKRRRAERNAKLLKLAMEDEGRQPRLLNALGDLQITLGNRGRALECFTHAVGLAEPNSTDLIEALYGLLSAHEEDQREEQFAAGMAALEVFPLDTQLLCIMGSYLQEQGQLELAARSFQTAAQHGQINPETWHLSNIGELAAFWHAVVLQLLGKDLEALNALREVAGREGATPFIGRNLLELLVKQGKHKEAMEQVDVLFAHAPREEAPERAALRTAVRGACLATEGNWPPALSFLRTAYTAGCRDAICLRSLALGHLAGGDHTGAEAYLRDWLQREPNNAEAQRYLEAAQGRSQTPGEALREAISPAGLGKIPAPPKTTDASHPLPAPHSREDTGSKRPSGN